MQSLNGMRARWDRMTDRHVLPGGSRDVERSCTWVSRSCQRRVMSTAGAVMAVAAGCAVLAAGVFGAGSLAMAAPAQAQHVDTAFESATSMVRMRLLSSEQYRNTIQYIFGPGISVNTNFAPFRRVEGFGLLEPDASTAGVTSGGLSEFERTAREVAGQVLSVRNRGFLLPCKPANLKRADRRCATEFLSSIGPLLYRRPLTRAELDESVDAADMAATHLKSFYTGLSYALTDMLISPNFLFVVDRTVPDPNHPGMSRLDGYSIATRLSLFLWDTGPDRELLREAARGQLYTTAGRERAVDRMLASPRLASGVRAFFKDLLLFTRSNDFGTLAKDPSIYPQFSGAVAQAAGEQVLRTIVYLLVTKDEPYQKLFTSRDTFMNPELSPIYDVPAAMGWTPYQFPKGSDRAGLLTLVRFLAAHSHAGESSPTLRGRAVREILLCEKIPNPPPDVNFSVLVNPPAGLKTMRQILALHHQNPVCAGCHNLMDPIGLGLENFDGAGQYRRTQKGAVINPSGTLDGIPFSNAIELGEAVAKDPNTAPCLVQRLYSYAVGGLSKNGDEVELSYLNKQFAEEGYRVPSLMKTIALSPAFVDVSEPAAARPKSTSVVAMDGSPESASP